MTSIKIKNFLLALILLTPISLFGKLYKGAEYRTIESFLYGRFEVRFKSSVGSGQTSTFFTYNDIDPMEQWNEIDIEILGRYTDDIQFNIINPRQGNNHVRHQFVPFDPSLDFHTYAFEWTPDYVAWFIDSVEVYRQTGDHITTLSKPQKIMMNIWNPEYENWVGPWFDKALPKFAYYDYVSYASFTPGSGDVGTDNNFSLQWFDDFEIWDQERWQKATHTFAGNKCDFEPQNIVFQDGFMILCLTDNDNLGFIDNVAPYILGARAGNNNIVVHFSEELDAASAGNINNYAIPGLDIQSVTLRHNGRVVDLIVSEFDSTSSYSLVATGIYDIYQNRLSAQMVNIAMPQPLTFPAKINVGGNTTAEFLEDQEWSLNEEYGYLDGNVYQVPSTQEITGTDVPEIYRSERWGIVKYNIMLPNGKYDLTLMMAENHYDETQKRIFDVYVEGSMIVQGLDLFAVAGKHAAHKIVVRDIHVEDEIIDIHFSAVNDNALLNGLIIEKNETRVNKVPETKPNNYLLASSYPNPFNSSTLIQYNLPYAGYLKMELFDVKGRKIDSLFNGNTSAGKHELRLNAEKLPSGLYFCQLLFQEQSQTIRLVLIK